MTPATARTTTTHAGSTDVPATARLAQWISSLKRADLPDAAWAHAKLCLLDALGCGLFEEMKDMQPLAALMRGVDRVP